MTIPTPPGAWVRWQSNKRNKSDWHWRHREDSTTYCGYRPTTILETVAKWNPLHVCQKCANRITREGY